MEMTSFDPWVYLLASVTAGFASLLFLPKLVVGATGLMARNAIEEARGMDEVDSARASFSPGSIKAGALVVTVFCLLAMLRFGPTMQPLLATILALGLVTASLIDLRHKLLPDLIVIPTLWVGLLCNTSGMFASLEDSVLGVILGYCALFIVCRVFQLLTGRVGMGDGDLKLVAAIAAWVGWQAIPMTLLMSSVIGLAMAIGYKVCSKENGEPSIPFGPALSIGGLLSVLYGSLMSSFFMY